MLMRLAVARIVHFLRLHLVGRTIKNVDAMEDPILFKDTTGSIFARTLEGRTVVEAIGKGKYFGCVSRRAPGDDYLPMTLALLVAIC